MAATSLIEQPPRLREHSTAGQFDAVRAKERLVEVLGDQRPHPVDSPGDDLVRMRLVKMIAKLGLNAIVRDQFACNRLVKRRGISCARVRNVIVPLGPPAGSALLLNAHYDSVPSGPGASDDGLGVATLLEIASILKKRPLDRPVILLFNEGEERGLLGARAFLADPLSNNVSSLINLEARGVSGPVNMFETSRPNAAAVSVFAAAVGTPVANSMATDVYRLLPNSTDVNSFSERKWLTFNFAPIGNETRYHSPGDDLDALDLRTLQHMGDQALSLTAALEGPPPGQNGERIFMDIAARVLISLPTPLGATLLGLLLAAFLVLSIRNKALIRGSAIMSFSLIGSTLFAWAMFALIGAAREGMFWRALPLSAHLAAYCSSILVAGLIFGANARSMRQEQLRSAFWLFYLLLGGLIGLFAQGAIIFFIFPPLVAAAGMLAGRWLRGAATAGSIGAILFLYLSWGGMLGLLGELLGNGPLWLFAPLGSLISLPILIEASPLLGKAGPRKVGIVAGSISFLAWALVAVAPAYSKDRQQRFVIEHVTDALQARSWWSISNDGASLPRNFPGSWRQGGLPFSDSKRWLSPAAAIAGVRAPAIRILSQIATKNEREVTFKVAANGNDSIVLLASADARILAAGRPGSILATAARDSGRFTLNCFGRSCDGATFELRIGQSAPIALTIIGTRPLTGGASLLAARPVFARPQYDRDQSLAFTQVRI